MLSIDGSLCIARPISFLALSSPFNSLYSRSLLTNSVLLYSLRSLIFELLFLMNRVWWLSFDRKLSELPDSRWYLFFRRYWLKSNVLLFCCGFIGWNYFIVGRLCKPGRMKEPLDWRLIDWWIWLFLLNSKSLREGCN
jgi:hypothetical protein